MINITMMMFIVLIGLMTPVVLPVEKDAGLREFRSVQELQEFLGDNHYTIYLVAGADGVVQLDGQCEDVAMSLCWKAREAGYIIETEILVLSETMKYYPADRRPEAPHCICKAFIHNEVWFIEPQDNRIWHAYNLD